MVYQSIPTLPEKIAQLVANIKAQSTMIKTPSDLDAALARHGLDFKVEKEERTNPRRNNETTGRFEIYRTDTGHMIGADRTDRYELIQNSTALEPIAHFAATQTDPVYLSKAHVFDNGSMISVSVDFGHMMIGDPKVGDVVFQRMTITTAHDGSGATRITIRPFRVKCSNGMIGFGDATAAHVIRHTKTAEERITQINATMRGVRLQMAKTEAVYQVLATAAVSRAQMESILDGVFPTEGKEKQAAKNAKEQREQVIAAYVNADGGFIDRNTAWNAFNAFTHYTTHASETRIHDEGRTPEQASALSKLNGAAAKLDHKALGTIVKVLELDDDIARILRAVETSQAAQLAVYAPAPVQTEKIDIFSIGMGG